MDALDKARAESDAVDAQLAALFERRMQATEQVAAYKKQQGLPIFDKEREQAVIEKNLARIHNQAYGPYYQAFLQHLMDLSKEYQAKLLYA